MGTTSTNYSSGSIGQIQGDANRVFEPFLYVVEALGGSISSSQNAMYNVSKSISHLKFDGWYAGSAIDQGMSDPDGFEFTNFSTQTSHIKNSDEPSNYAG